jgi:hypothetical protein
MCAKHKGRSWCNASTYLQYLGYFTDSRKEKWQKEYRDGF